MKNKNRNIKICMNCGRERFGFWKYGPSKACSKDCLRQLIKDRIITTIPPYSAFPELGIIEPNKLNKN